MRGSSLFSTRNVRTLIVRTLTLRALTFFVLTFMTRTFRIRSITIKMWGDSSPPHKQMRLGLKIEIVGRHGTPSFLRLLGLCFAGRAGFLFGLNLLEGRRTIFGLAILGNLAVDHGLERLC